jgi:predicted MFS family arabinose efflux permease
VLGATSLQLSFLVLAAGPAGLAGILLGRWSADRFGRRITGALAMSGTAIAVAIAYSGGSAALAIGYRTTVLLASAFAPEKAPSPRSWSPPTSVRPSPAGSQ